MHVSASTAHTHIGLLVSKSACNLMLHLTAMSELCNSFFGLCQQPGLFVLTPLFYGNNCLGICLSLRLVGWLWFSEGYVQKTTQDCKDSWLQQPQQLCQLGMLLTSARGYIQCRILQRIEAWKLVQVSVISK